MSSGIDNVATKVGPNCRGVAWSALIFIFCFTEVRAQNDLELWYRQPARVWTEAMPLGNGRLGAMIFGGTTMERIQLNEESLWAGSKINNNNPLAKEHLPEIQQALFDGKYEDAWQMADKYLLGVPPEIRSYQPLGDVYIKHSGNEESGSYRRTLQLNDGISRTIYAVNGNRVVREVFVSAPHDVIVVSIAAQDPINVEISLGRQRDVGRYDAADGVAWLNGQIHDDDHPKKGPGGKHMRFSAAMKILSTDGLAAETATDTATGFTVARARNIVFAVTAATDYNLEDLDTDIAIDPLRVCKDIIAIASKVQLQKMRKAHVLEHRAMFDRVKLELDGDDALRSVPTDERLAAVKEGGTDLGLVVLYYQYGRYLLMSSSRPPGRLPANLQGIWNDQYAAKWNSDFHTNINLQMNYWPAETGNLPETTRVLGDFLRQLVVPGSATAREMYGAEGWTLHHLTDVYGRTGVADGVWGFSPLAGAWMTFPIFEHYAFTRDRKYLKEIAYPIIKGSVRFILDFLIQSPDGYLVTNPSHSPENPFVIPGTGKKEKSYLTYAATIDTQIIHGLFDNFTSAAEVLGVDTDLIGRVNAARQRLPPMKVGRNGTLQEWIHDYEEFEPGHRHISHLLGLYPLDLITPSDSVLFEAAAKTIERRLAYSTRHVGWSSAWIINFYARLLDGDKAGEQVQRLLQHSTLGSLLNSIPPFQIDGNFGGAAGIAEMLMQSHDNVIHILPALPATWRTGAISGVCARGGYHLDFAWREGELRKLIIDAPQRGIVTVRYDDVIVALDLKKGRNDLSRDKRIVRNANLKAR